MVRVEPCVRGVAVKLPAAAGRPMTRPTGALLAFAIVNASLGGNDPFDFQPYVQYTAGSYSTGVDAADVNGDGHVDLAISNRSSNSVSVRFNLGDGTFPTVAHIPVGLEPRYVVAADFDGNGWPDLATANAIGNSLTVLLNDGTGGFEPPATIPAVRPAWLAAADLDNDGDVDLAVTECDGAAVSGCSDPSLLTWFDNDGSGGFTPIQSVPIGVHPRGGAIADLDGDGRLDVAITNLNSDTISIVLNTGQGAFAPATHVPAGAAPRYLAAADLTGNGAVDLAVVHKVGADLWIFENGGRGDFTAPPEQRYAVHNEPHSVALADLDGDGRREIIVSHVTSTVWVDVFLNAADGIFIRQSIPSPPGASHVIGVDLDADDDLDIVTTASTGRIAVHLNDTPQHCRADLDDSGDVGFTDLLTLLTLWGPCPDPCPGDLDGNGAVDFVDLLTMVASWGRCEVG